MLTTAGKLLFAGDGSQHWSPSIRRTAKSFGTPASAKMSRNGPITYMLDGQQYLLIGAGDSLYAMAVQQ